MGTRDPRVDACIARSAPFAQPILEHIRIPHFIYHGMLGGMSAFKAHCAFGFWKGKLVVPEQERAAMGQENRARRVAQAVEWMAEGKARNWKYQK